MSDRVIAILWVVLSSALCVAGQLLAKASLARTTEGGGGGAAGASFVRALFAPGVVGGGILLVAGTLLWFRVLPRLDFSLAMPLSCLLTLALSVAGGILAFGERIDLARGVGLTLALAAIAFLARSPGK